MTFPILAYVPDRDVQNIFQYSGQIDFARNGLDFFKTKSNDPNTKRSVPFGKERENGSGEAELVDL